MSDYLSLPPAAGNPERRSDAVLIRVYRMPPREIGYVTSLVEAFDGIGLVRTLDRARGVVECWVMADYEADFDGLIESLRAEFPVQRLPREFD
jgi:hypothetical protein